MSKKSTNTPTVTIGQKPREKFAPGANREQLDNLKDNDLVSFNSAAELQFCDFICAYLEEYQQATQFEIIQESSFELNISPITAKRYLIKHTARRARFMIVKKSVFCKEHKHERKYEIKISRK